MKKLLLALLALPLFIACNKDDDECTLSSAAVAGTYKVTAVRYKATASSAEQDYYGIVFTDPCERDDTHTLNSNGTYNFTDAGTQCSPSNSYNGTWSLSGNTITIDGDAGNVDAFNCSTMTVSASNVFVAGDKFIVVYTRQ